MELKDMTIDALEERKSAIVAELENDGADLDSLESEMRSINEELETRKAEEAKKAEIRSMVASGAGEVVKEIKTEERKDMKDIKEFRNSQEYMNLYAEYLKTGKDDEIRAALLTTNATDGTIAVPDMVYDIIKTAWDKNEIMNLVPKTEVKGNLKVNFEISGSDAVVHTEGSGAVAEEELVEGIISIVPAFVKKWKSFSDEVMAMRGEAFIQYIYDELAYRIVKKMADLLIGQIAALPATATATSVSANKVETAPVVGAVAQALGQLSDEATNPVVVMNKATWSLFKAAQYANGYNVDPFEGFDVHFNNSLPVYGSASTGAVYAIVGDFAEGTLANFPNGEEIEYTFDELTRKKEDLVEVLGKVYVGLGVIGDKSFALLTKPAEA
jgi:HK97 family phage major capsid protein